MIHNETFQFNVVRKNIDKMKWAKGIEESPFFMSIFSRTKEKTNDILHGENQQKKNYVEREKVDCVHLISQQTCQGTVTLSF